MSVFSTAACWAAVWVGSKVALSDEMMADGMEPWMAAYLGATMAALMVGQKGFCWAVVLVNWWAVDLAGLSVAEMAASSDDPLVGQTGKMLGYMLVHTELMAATHLPMWRLYCWPRQRLREQLLWRVKSQIAHWKPIIGENL